MIDGSVSDELAPQRPCRDRGGGALAACVKRARWSRPHTRLTLSPTRRSPPRRPVAFRGAWL